MLRSYIYLLVLLRPKHLTWTATRFIIELQRIQLLVPESGYQVTKSIVQVAPSIHGAVSRNVIAWGRKQNVAGHHQSKLSRV